MKAWYCIQTKSRQEEVAKENLHRQGYEVYLPMSPVDKRKCKVKEKEPLFPGYIFTLLDDQVGDWSTIEYTYGVINLVRFGDKPAIVPNSLIGELKLNDCDDGVQSLAVIDYQTNDPVIIKSAPFQHCHAIVHSAANDRVTLLMDILGTETRVHMSYADIEPI